MRIVIAGAGAVGTHLAKLLSRERHDIVLLDENPGRLETIGADFEVAEGATATVNGASASFDDKVVVNGELVFDATGITFDEVLVVYGTYSVA